MEVGKEARGRETVTECKHARAHAHTHTHIRAHTHSCLRAFQQMQHSRQDKHTHTNTRHAYIDTKAGLHAGDTVR